MADPSDRPAPSALDLLRRLEALEARAAPGGGAARDPPGAASALPEELARRLLHQKFLTRVAGALLGTDGAGTARSLADALRETGAMYALDRIGLYWEEGSRSVARERWSREPHAAFPDALDAAEEPWIRTASGAARATAVASPDDAPAAAPALRRFMTRHGIGSLVAAPLEAEGRALGCALFASRTAPRTWSDGEVEELRLLASLIAAATVRARMHERLRASELRYRNVVEDQTDFIVRWKPDGTRTFVNGSYCRAFGIDPDEAIGTSFFPLISQEDRRAVRERLLALSPEHPVSTAEHRVILPDGGTGWQRWTDRAVFDAAGELVEMQSVGRDITARKAAEEALERANAELRALQERVLAENVYLREEIELAHGAGELVGSSEPHRRCLREIERVAPTSTTVLILGETGTGKELIARRIHDLSERRDRPLICLNCAALPAHLAESELFGHERGAFTGAEKRRAGRFELADRGTLFLDEVGDLPKELQPKLLRALEDGRFERVGGSETLAVDVRVIAATHRDLEAAVADGSFRRDLYYRLGVYPIRVPALRDRRDDIPELALHLVAKHARRLGREVGAISSRTLEHLRRRDWPGNIRELENWVERALITATGPVLDVGAEEEEEEAAPAPRPAGARSGSERLSEAMRTHILRVLASRQWRIEGATGAAVALGLRPSTLRSRMKRLGIVRETGTRG